MAGWLEILFAAKQVAEGNVVRRAQADIERLVSMEALQSEVQERGFHMVRIGAQIIILCNEGDIEVIC